MTSITGLSPSGFYIRDISPVAILTAIVLSAGCADAPHTTEPPSSLTAAGAARSVETRQVAAGREIFRFDDFGDWRFWTDTLRLNDLVETVSPVQALALGLKVDAAAVPPQVLQAVLADPALLNDPATTRALLSLDAVVGLVATVEGDQITRIGTTCALCHSTVDNAVTTGIGNRLDGWPNRDLEVGTIISLTPGLPAALKPVYASWAPGFYDPRFNIDGINSPVVLPPAYGLQGVGLETYTGEGPISYWNAYVAVTQMHGQGSFSDPRLGIDIRVPPQEDLVSSKLPALRQYQLSLAAPAPPPGSFDAQAAARGEIVFRTAAECASCHVGPRLTGHGNLHDPSETGMDPTYAQRTTTKQYRATPLRGLWQRAPYFHDGSAPTLAAVVDHYDTVLQLGLTAGQKADLIEYLKSL
jgi:mono/diheme cytochrome c family protein